LQKEQKSLKKIEQEKNISYLFIDDLENLLTRQGYYFEKTYLLFLKGIYLIKTNQVELGKKECSKAMKICKEYTDILRYKKEKK